jgi:DNA-binding SARP family transcriptional activator/Flp pilus assembly protein TadD/TolB-like protein
MSRLLTLGRFELVAPGPGGDMPVQVQPKRLALLAYLAAGEPGAPHRRDTLLGLFWPELGPDEARRALRQALHHLRGHLGDGAIASRSDDHVSLGNVSSDVADFRRLAASGREAEALDLYRGDFLAGVFLSNVAPDCEEWVYQTRRRLREIAVGAARRLSDRQRAAGDLAGAATAAARAHRIDPDDESTLRLAVERLAQAGDRARALRLYEDFAKRLHDEYDASPAAETRGLGDAVRAAPADLSAAELERIALSAAPAPAPPVADTRPVVRAPPHRRARYLPAFAGTGVLLVAIAVALLWHAGGVDARPTGSDPDAILVADLADLAGDPSLARALSHAVRIDLAQFPGLEVLSPQQIVRLLRLTDIATIDLALDDSLARVLATREGLKAVVTGEVGRVGGRYTVTARVVAAADGRLIASHRESADSTDLVDAIGRLTGRLRHELGQSMRSLPETPSLSRVTTGSLPALRKYSEAVDAMDSGERHQGIALFREAVMLDTAFADAYRMLGALYAAEGDGGRAAEAQRRAVLHADRLPLYDRYLVLGSYHLNITGDWDKAIAAYRSLLELFPNSKPGLNNLSLVYARTRQYARADTLLLRVIELDSTIASVWLGLAQSYINQGRFADAKHTLDEIARRFPDNPVHPMTEAYLGAAAQAWTAAERSIRIRLQRGIERERPLEVMDAHQTLGQILLATGRLAEAERELRTVIRIAEEEAVPRRAIFASVQLGWLELRYRRRPDRALAVVDSVLARHPLARVVSGDRPYGELTELFVALGRLDRAQAVLRVAERDTAARNDLDGSPGRLMRGHIAMSEARYRAAASELRTVAATDRCPVCALPALAELQEQSGDREGAILTWERYLTTPWMWRFESDAAHLGWARLRLASLYEHRGRSADARRQYELLLRLWSAADPELKPILEQVRTEFLGGNG